MSKSEVESIDKKRHASRVEIAGVKVSQALIDSAVEATSSSQTVDEIERRERARTRKIIIDDELRVDIDVSKQITNALLREANKPESQRINIDDLPVVLQRVVLAHVKLQEAQEEYDAAVVELQKPVTCRD